MKHIEQNVPHALVLTWDSVTTRVLCPYKCAALVHRHGTTLPREGRLNHRFAHCMPDEDCAGEVRSYHLVYPFEKEKITDTCWWILDTIDELSGQWSDDSRGRWRTIRWDFFDPDYLPAKVPSDDNETQRMAENDSAEDTDLASLFHDLTLDRSANERKQREWFVSHCVNNEVAIATELLDASSDPNSWFRASSHDGLTVLNMACEEGHLDVVEMLIERGAKLELRDGSGRTPLLCALQYGRSQVAHYLLCKRASTVESRTQDKSYIEATTDTLKDLKGRRRFAQQEIAAARRPPLPVNYKPEVIKVYGPDGKSYLECEEDPGALFDILRRSAEEKREVMERAQARLEKYDIDIASFEEILQILEEAAERERLQILLSEITAEYGEEQSQYLSRKKTFDVHGIITSVMKRLLEVQPFGRNKTIALMTRGTALPLRAAISGWTHQQCAVRRGVVDNVFWTQQAHALAETLGHKIPAHDYDGKKEGNYFACHSEKLLLAHLIYHHTLDLAAVDSLTMRACSPENLEGLEVNIYVAQPNKESPTVCDDCKEFCQKVVERYLLTLKVYVVTGGQGGPQASLAWSPVIPVARVRRRVRRKGSKAAQVDVCQ